MTKPTNITKLRTVDRPSEVAFITALEDVIDEFASGKMTIAEILGCLDFVSKQFFASEVMGYYDEQD